MKIRVAFARHNITATLEDSVSARDFVSMLPLDLMLQDFAHNEKIAHLPRKLDETDRGPFSNSQAGDLCYYIPWGNLAMFYDDYTSSPDLIRLGRFDGGVAPLMTRGTFPLRITLLEPSAASV